MILKSKETKAGLAYTIGNMLIKGIAFISTPLFARLMLPSDYGVVNNYLAYESIFCVFVGLLLYSSVKNAKYEFSDTFDKYISNIIFINILTTIIFAVLINIFSGFFEKITGLNTKLQNLLVFNCFSNSIYYIFSNYISLNYEYKKYLIASGFNAIFNIIISLLLMLTVLKNDPSTARVIGYFVPIAIIALFVSGSFFKKAKPDLNREQISFGLKFSLPLIPNGLSDILLSQFDRLMIRNMAGDWELGIYSLSYNIYAIIGVLRNSLDMVWGPWCYKQLSSNDNSMIKKRAAQYAGGICILSCLLILISPEIVFILGSKEYISAKYSAIPLIVASFFVMLNTLPTHVLYFYKKTKFVSLSAIMATVLNVVLNVIFIKLYGYIAAAYTTTASYLLLFILNFIFMVITNKKQPLPLVMIVLYIVIIILISAFSLIFINEMVIRMIAFSLIMIILFVIGLIFFKKYKGKKNEKDSANN